MKSRIDVPQRQGHLRTTRPGTSHTSEDGLAIPDQAQVVRVPPLSVDSLSRSSRLLVSNFGVQANLTRSDLKRCATIPLPPIVTLTTCSLIASAMSGGVFPKNFSST
jgi:hypothetical protein